MVLNNVIRTLNISTEREQSETGNESQKKNLDARMMLLQKHNLPSRRSQNGIDFELSRFANIKVQEPDVLSFRRDEEPNYPTMAAIANVLLSKPATSAASENAFSVAGALISRRRSSIDPLRARKMLFIHDNYDLLHET